MIFVHTINDMLAAIAAAKAHRATHPQLGDFEIAMGVCAVCLEMGIVMTNGVVEDILVTISDMAVRILALEGQRH
ncbi:hypothetical protein UFOVP1616_6 [uncultured Caudovirales phage]|uniref:Uncharacterized protein n=1 Tax=uncultured Caudovirales phage TaxID=2100421 RepID=A0A6J5SW91_9CAUD|nr:hypothetical protein UFOVP1467_22 [uncultured Caudovirales phage]CAB4219625.1 hypothetical protein UFOVP1616_6 [uncultured Caudovirales phage]